MKTRSRRAFTLFQLLVILALLAVLFALLLPAIAKRAPAAAARNQSANNLRANSAIAIAKCTYNDANGTLPPGNDNNNFSGLAYILPYIEQNNVYQLIDFKKPMDDKANAAARAPIIKVFLSPRDGIMMVNKDFGATNYLFNAGSKPSLEDNDGIFYQDSKVKFPDITDGTSNTLSLWTCARQNVLLKKGDLKDIKDETGVKDWKDDKNIAADRCASWMDGRFLQGTFTGTRNMNDEKPDVNCAVWWSVRRSEAWIRNGLFRLLRRQRADHHQGHQTGRMESAGQPQRWRGRSGLLRTNSYDNPGRSLPSPKEGRERRFVFMSPTSPHTHAGRKVPATE